MISSSLMAIVAAAGLSWTPAPAQTHSPTQGQKQTTKKSKSKTAKKPAKNQATQTREANESTSPEVRPGRGVTAPDPTKPGTPPTFPRTEPAPDSPVNPPDPTAPTTTKPPAD